MHKATQKYLFHYAEPEAQEAFFSVPAKAKWDLSLVVPVYREWDHFLKTFASFRESLSQKTLVILVINDHQKHEINEALLKYLLFQTNNPGRLKRPFEKLYFIAFSKTIDLLVVNRATKGLYFSEREGVGLARKMGFDIALQFYHMDRIKNPFIHTTDSDAVIPKNYGRHYPESDVAALTYPFSHDPSENREAQLYEAWLRHYVSGLQTARSPYAHQSIGSTIAVRAESYATVRGFPSRKAAEDFYILNKLRKVGRVWTPPSDSIRLSSRVSHRVPFGTGPAIARIKSNTSSLSFYPQESFLELKRVLIASELYLISPEEVRGEIQAIERHHPFLQKLGFANRLVSIHQNRDDFRQRIQEFHDWFDALKTLRFIRETSNNISRSSEALPSTIPQKPALASRSN